MSEDRSYDVILLFGPPTQNKSSYVPASYIRQDFVVISLEETFKDNPSLGLRDVTLNVVSLLKEKKQVFLEDEFRLKSTRSSILTTLKKKVPKCSILLLKVIPQHGVRQVCWSHQFSHVDQKEIFGNCEFSQVKKWFDESLLNLVTNSDYIENPDEKEGFDIKEISIPLQVTHNFKFEIPCLFIQWEALISPSEDQEILSGMEEIIQKWKSQNKNGRIVFIYDGKNLAKGYVLESDEDNSMRKHLRGLAAKIEYPVYVLSIKSMSRISHFCIPPQPGILAFLQYQHGIDLHSKQTIYIYDSVEHMNMAQATGIRNIKGNKAQKLPDFIFKRPTVAPQIPNMFKSIEYVGDEQSLTTTSLPLFDLRARLTEGCVLQTYDNGLSLSVYVPNVEVFSSAQESHTGSLFRRQVDLANRQSPEATQSYSTKRENQINNLDQDLPVWMGKRLRRESTLDSVSSMDNQSGSDSGTSYRCNKTVYIMTEKELHEMAFQVLAQAGKDMKKDLCNPRQSPSTSKDPE